MGSLAIAVSQVPVILADDPAIRQLEIALLGEPFQLVHGSVIQTVFAIVRKSILSDADFIPRNQRQCLGFVNLESRTLAQW